MKTVKDVHLQSLMAFYSFNNFLRALIVLYSTLWLFAVVNICFYDRKFQ